MSWSKICPILFTGLKYVTFIYWSKRCQSKRCQSKRCQSKRCRGTVLTGCEQVEIWRLLLFHFAQNLKRNLNQTAYIVKVQHKYLGRIALN